VTERAVFRLEPDGLALVEIAPGLDVKDVLNQIPFPVIVQKPIARMPEDIFQATVVPFDLPKQPTGKIATSQGR
jgi:acyl CoA:acetate/3-ketoacid CoA transferase